jgi:hypothetical protein
MKADPGNNKVASIEGGISGKLLRRLCGMRIGIIICSLAIFLSASILGAEVVTDGLVSYYTLDNKDIQDKSVKDMVGKSDGTIAGEPKSVEGHLGEALEFDGVDDCVRLPQVLTIGEEAVSYECWFSKPGPTGWSYLIVNKTDFHNNFFRLGFNQNTGQLRFYTEHENEANNAWVTDAEYADGEWHHVVATREEGEGKMYVDGELVKQSIAMTGDIGGDKTDWYLAQDGNQAGFLQATMDEVRIYNRALTLEEVQQNFESRGMVAVHSRGKLSITWGAIKTGP